MSVLALWGVRGCLRSTSTILTLHICALASWVKFTRDPEISRCGAGGRPQGPWTRATLQAACRRAGRRPVFLFQLSSCKASLLRPLWCPVVLHVVAWVAAPAAYGAPSPPGAGGRPGRGGGGSWSPEGHALHGDGHTVRIKESGFQQKQTPNQVTYRWLHGSSQP